MRRALWFLALAICVGCVGYFVKGYLFPTKKAPPVVVVAPVVRNDSCEKTQAPLTAITWNVALAPGMNILYKPRIPAVVQAVKTQKFDVMCIQESWLAEDKKAIIAASGLPPENVFTHDTSGLAEDEADTCTDSNLELLLACAKASCGNRPPEDDTICALEECGTPLKLIYASNKRCMNCLAAMAGRPASDIISTCSNGSASRVFHGQNGLILLSRWPLHDKEIIELPSSNANRPALIARVNVPGMSEPIEVACTHLSSPQRVPPFHSGAATWEIEQQMQQRVVVDRLAERAKGRPSLFLGDMNYCAKDGDTIRGYSESACADAKTFGFNDPAAEAQPPFCSVCGDNTVRGSPGDVGLLFDHVLYRDPEGGATLEPICTDRLQDQLVTVTDHRGQQVRTNISDHYAVRVKFGFK
jgi:endonuclease/exonuclease/phosphatase family metal-dependent hydrolase